MQLGSFLFKYCKSKITLRKATLSIWNAKRKTTVLYYNLINKFAFNVYLEVASFYTS